MSLSRFINFEELINRTIRLKGLEISKADLKLLPYSVATPLGIPSEAVVEAHIYDNLDNLLISDYNYNIFYNEENHYYNIKQLFLDNLLVRGSYKTCFNFYSKLFGDSANLYSYVQEISPEATELKLGIYDQFKDSEEYANFIKFCEFLFSSEQINNIVVNFLDNKVSKVVNVRFEDDSFYLKLYSPISYDLPQYASCWIGYEWADSIIDNINIILAKQSPKVNNLKGPNFNFDFDEVTNSSATYFKTWDEILDSDLTSNQAVIDSYFSSSFSTILNIDYTDFKNFVFYSSAKERLESFTGKLELIEHYTSQSLIINSSSASGSIYSINNVLLNEKRKNGILSSFDSFEKWMYYQNTSSIFTHDITGSISPYPKYLSGSSYHLHNLNSPIVQSWYYSASVVAEDYDSNNENRLSWAVPGHIYNDENNSEYLLFLDMVGHHFDILYSYVSAITSIHQRDEHPNRGIPNQLLYEYAKSFGWKLQNSKQLSELWLYKLGVNSSGSYSDVGELFSLPHENINHQIWRRIVNNLPFLLKTKGTERGARALISIYGVPNTLISIKEFGGPSKKDFSSNTYEQRHQFSLMLQGSQSLQIPHIEISSSLGNYELPQTYSFRFKTEYKPTYSSSLWSIAYSKNGDLFLDLGIEPFSGNYSGSEDFGRLKLRYNYPYSESYSNYLPFYNGDFWSVFVRVDDTLKNYNLNAGSLAVLVQRASDYVDVNIGYSSSFSSYVYSNRFVSSSLEEDKTYIILGGGVNNLRGNTLITNTAPEIVGFSGSIQNYKEFFSYLSQDTVNRQTLNPGSYEGNSFSSSYYDLYRYYPLGLDNIRKNISIISPEISSSLSSSHPYQSYDYGNNTTASLHGFSGSEDLYYDSSTEIYYTFLPYASLKIRKEDNNLIGNLSPDTRAEISSFDSEKLDSDKLIIAFSPSDQFNRDIINQYGPFYLDDWIGDPDDTLKDEYTSLRWFRSKYWIKYIKNKNINDFIKIFSLYNYTLFEQIKNLVPARSNYIGGVLIEPTILERPRVRRDSLSVQHWKIENTLQNFTPPPRSDFIKIYTGSIDWPVDPEIEHIYKTGSLSREVFAEIEHIYKTGSLSREVFAEIEHIYRTASLSRECSLLNSSINSHLNNLDLLGSSLWVTDKLAYSGCLSYTQSYISNQRLFKNYSKVNYFYSCSNDSLNFYQKQFSSYISKSYGWYYSKSLEPANYQYDEDSVVNRIRYSGCKLVGSDFNVDSTQTFDGKPVVEIYNVPYIEI